MPFGVRLFTRRLVHGGERTREPPVEHVRDLAVTPDLAFVLDGAGLEVRTIDDPGRVRAQVEIALGTSVVAEGALARVTCGDRVVVVDAGDPDAPVVRATAPREAGSTAICITPDALVAIDLSDPACPREASRVALRNEPLDLAVDDGLAFVASGRVGVRCFDVRDPTRIVEAGRLVSGDARGVDARDGRAWILESGRGVRAWNVARREKGGFVPFRGPLLDARARIRAWGPHVLVASRGLVILPRPD